MTTKAPGRHDIMATCHKHIRHQRKCIDCQAEEIRRKSAYAEEPKPELVRVIVKYPCQRGIRCEWATNNGMTVTCSRLLGGCVKT